MSPTRFANLAGAYGARLDRWPVDEQAAAAEFLHARPDAQELLDAQRPLDAALDAWVVHTPPFLAEAVATRVLRRASATSRLLAWLAGLAAATALAGGAAAGVTVAGEMVAGVSMLPATGEVSSLYGLSVLGAPLAGSEADDSDADGGS